MQDDPRDLDYLDNELGLSNYGGSFEEEYLKSIVGFSFTEETFLKIEKAMLVVVNEAQLVLSTGSMHHLKSIFVRSGETNKFQRLQNKETVEKYSRYLARLCCCIVKVATTAEAPANFELTPLLMEKCTSVIESLEHPILHPGLPERLLCLLWALYSQRLDSSTFNRYSCWVFRFFVLAAYYDEKVNNSKDLSHPLAMLKFGCRITLMLWRARNTARFDEEECISLITHHLIMSPFVVLHEASQLVRAAAANSDEFNVRIICRDGDFDNCVIDDKHFYLHQLKEAVWNGLERANELLQELVFHNETMIQDISLAVLGLDSLNDSTVGYSFLDQTVNLRKRKRVLNFVLNDTQLASEFKLDQDEVGRGAIEVYLDKCWELMKLNFFLMHVTGGI